MSTPTILQIIPRLDTGGAEKTTVEIARALMLTGSKPIVATGGGRLASQITDLGGEVIEFPADTKNPFRLYGNISKLSKLIVEKNIDLVHVRSRAPAWSSYYACQRTGRPFVTTYHGAYSSTGPMKNRYNSIMARGDLVIANSRFTADLINEEHGLSDERLRIVYRGVDVREFSRNAITDQRMSDVLSQWGVDPSSRIILHAARLTNWKGQKTVIEAAAELHKRGLTDGVQFVLAGDAQGRDEYLKELKDLIKERGVEGCVKLVGHVDDMAAAYTVSSVAVVASIEPEAFGRAAAEGQASGKPVIVTDIGAARETVIAARGRDIEGATGWRIAPNDPLVLADSIATLFDIPETQRHVMGLRARDHIATNFSLDQMCLKTLKVYDELLGTRLGPLYVRRQGLDVSAPNS